MANTTMNRPFVGFKSFCSLNAKEIIRNILDCSRKDRNRNERQALTLDADQAIDINFDGNGRIAGYRCEIATKYFHTEITLIDLDDVGLEALKGSEIDKNFEALFLCFDRGDEVIFDHVKEFSSFITRNKLELPVIIFHHKKDDIDNASDDLDLERRLLELGTFALMDLYPDAPPNNPIPGEYRDIYDLLKNHVWSTITTMQNNSHLYKDILNAEAAEEADTAIEHLTSNSSGQGEWNNFETLLQRVQQFKQNASNFSREALLDNAEILAEKFAQLIGEDD